MGTNHVLVCLLVLLPAAAWFVAVASLRSWLPSREVLLRRSQKVSEGWSMRDVLLLLGHPTAGPFPADDGRTVCYWMKVQEEGDRPPRRFPKWPEIKEALGFGEPPSEHQRYLVEVQFDRGAVVAVHCETQFE